LDGFKKLILGVFFPSSGQSSWSNVIKIFQPFEITDCDTTSIKKYVWKESDSFLEHDFFSCHCGRTIGAFSNYFTLEFVGIL